MNDFRASSEDDGFERLSQAIEGVLNATAAVQAELMLLDLEHAGELCEAFDRLTGALISTQARIRNDGGK